MKGEWKALVTLVVLTVVLLPVSFWVLDRFARKYKQAGQELRFRQLVEPLALLVLCGGLALLAFVGVVRGRFWVLEIPFQLATGWFLYFARVVDDVRPDVWTVLSGVACVGGAGVGLHSFLRWLTSSGGCEWPARRTAQVLLLLAVMFAAGLAVTGLVQQTGWLIRTPDPVTKDNRLIS